MRVGLRGNQTCCQLILLQEHSVGHTQLGKVVLGLAAEAANVFINILYIISISLYFLTVEIKLTSLKSLRLRKLLDQTFLTGPYWGPSGSLRVLLCPSGP